MVMDPARYKEQTIRAYNLLTPKLAGEFDCFFEKFARLEAVHFLANLGQDGAILDLGCGAGPASSYFIEHGYTAVSADLSKEMLKECKMRGLSNIVRLDLEALPFQYHAFDAIWAHTSLLHIPKEKLARTLEAIGNTLKIGGTLFVALKEGKGEGYTSQTTEGRWFSNFKEKEFEEYVPKGFEIIKNSRNKLNRCAFLNYHLVKRFEY